MSRNVGRGATFRVKRIPAGIEAGRGAMVYVWGQDRQLSRGLKWLRKHSARLTRCALTIRLTDWPR